MTAKATEAAPTGLALLRVPFAANQISKLPKGGVMLDFVGHAALTDRLLNADINWNWEPLALDGHGLPAYDPSGGMWIKLTVCGQTRLGYGHAGAKKGGDAIKEIIGDALRNAAMRFGAALDLWHKGDLHLDDTALDGGEGQSDEREVSPPATETQDDAVQFINDDQAEWIINMLDQHNIPAAKLLKAAGIRTVTSLPAAEYEKARKWVNAAIASKEIA